MLICAACGAIPAYCECHVPSPLQKLVNKQREDAGLWAMPDDDFEKRLQQAIRDLHRAIEVQRTTGR